MNLSKFITKRVLVLALLVLATMPLFAETAQGEDVGNGSKLPLSFFIEAETGVLKVLSHTFQSGENGSKFNYVTQGGQEILFPYARVVLGALVAERHEFTALYQPLTVNTTVTFREAVTIDGVTFTAGTPMDLKYGFDFWRLTYGYDLLAAENIDFLAGLSLQMRNASIVFQQVDGAQSTTNQNLGLVPALYTAFTYRFNSGVELDFEATGIYASSAFINGADFNFEGSLLDSSIGVVLPLQDKVQTFVKLRYIGGSSNGTSDYPDLYWTKASEDFGANYLSTMSLTAGIRLQ